MLGCLRGRLCGGQSRVESGQHLDLSKASVLPGRLSSVAPAAAPVALGSCFLTPWSFMQFPVDSSPWGQ